MTSQAAGQFLEDGHFFHPDGRAKLLFEAPRPLPEPIDERYPLILLSGRGTSSQWHTRVHVTHVVQPGQVFVPMHYSAANQLTFAAFDPYSRQPSYKYCAVQIRKSDPFAD